MPAQRIATTRQRDMQPLAVAGQTTIEAWLTLQTLLTRELGPAHAALLAEPVPNPALGEVDWYADAAGPVRPVQALPPAEQAALWTEAGRLVEDTRALAARLGGSRIEGDRFLAEMLALALPPANAAGQPELLPEDLYAASRPAGPGLQPVLVGWGHSRVAARGAARVLTGAKAPVAAAMAILPPPPSPYHAAPRRTWLWGVLAASLAVPALALLLLWRDPFGWFQVDVAACRIMPGQLDLARALQDETAQEGVLRAELSRLAADAGQRRLMCPPIQPPAPPERQAALPAPPPPSADEQRAQRRGAQGGKMQVILAWDDRNDLDLRIVCPDGTDINFIRRNACGGTLDVDANGDVNSLTDTPVENVFFAEPQPGAYRIIVDPYGMRVRPNTPFRVTIRRDGRPDEVISGTAVNGRHNQQVGQFRVDPS